MIQQPAIPGHLLESICQPACYSLFYLAFGQYRPDLKFVTDVPGQL
jgi:hypothetical protein